MFFNKSIISISFNYEICIDLIEKGEQLVVFPEGKINKSWEKLVLKEGLYRLARLAAKKTESIIIIPIGIAYSKISLNLEMNFVYLLENL